MMRASEVELARGIERGDKAAVARALNLIEDRRPAVQPRIQRLLAELRARAGLHRVGLTGPPGVGKSSLAAQLAREWRARGLSVGVLAVDPSSTRSGGALLGDRARMGFDPQDGSLFVRSLATAGETGGLAYAAHAIVEVLSAAYDRVLVETTGVGQTETDIEHVVDTVALVVQPGSGDVLQFIKAGIMEIPDVIVVNKGDHKRLATRAAADLAGALDALHTAGLVDREEATSRVPVLITSARERSGIDALADAIEAHSGSMSPAGLAARRRAGAVHWATSLVLRRYGEFGLELLGGRDGVRAHLLAGLDRGRSPITLAAELGEKFRARLASVR